MEGFLVLLYVIMFVWGILNIILFFKLWGMTNNVKKILDVLNSKDNRDVKLPNKAVVKGIDGEVNVLRMKNGKVECRRFYGSGWEDYLYDIDRLEFINDEQEEA